MSESADFYISWLGCSAFGVGSTQRLVEPIPSAFVPTDLSNCIIWFDANNGDTIAVDSKDDTSILSWQSLGTSSNLMEPTTGTGFYNTHTINTLPVVYFPASNQMSWYGSISGQEKTVFFLTTSLSELSVLAVPFMDNITGNASEGFQMGSVYSGGNYIFTTCINGVVCASAYTASNPYNIPQVLAWRITSNLGSNFFHQNGSNITLTDNFAASGYSELPIPYDVNRLDGSSQDVGEIIVYNRALTDREVTQVESYLFTKWSIS